MTNTICDQNVEDCSNLTVNSIKNYGPSNCCYRLWGPLFPDPHRPNTILVHGASIRLLPGGFPIPGHILKRPNYCFCQLGPLLHNEIYGGHNIWEFEYADELFVVPVTNERVYLNFGCLDKYGKRLKEAIGIVKAQNPGVYVNIVAHSMGGLVARSAAQDPEMVGQINKIITLDTGHYGFDMAAFFDHFFVENLPEEIRHNACVVHDTAPGSEFLTNLNCNFKHCRVTLLSLAAGSPLPGNGRVVSLESAHLGEGCCGGRIIYNEQCTPYRIVPNVDHLSIIEIYDESHPVFGLIKAFLWPQGVRSVRVKIL